MRNDRRIRSSFDILYSAVCKESRSFARCAYGVTEFDVLYTVLNFSFFRMDVPYRIVILAVSYGVALMISRVGSRFSFYFDWPMCRISPVPSSSRVLCRRVFNSSRHAIPVVSLRSSYTNDAVSTSRSSHFEVGIGFYSHIDFAGCYSSKPCYFPTSGSNSFPEPITKSHNSYPITLPSSPSFSLFPPLNYVHSLLQRV